MNDKPIIAEVDRVVVQHLSSEELRRLEIDAKFIKAGHLPENTNCDHKHWRSVLLDGRYCNCGTCMVDFGD